LAYSEIVDVLFDNFEQSMERRSIKFLPDNPELSWEICWHAEAEKTGPWAANRNHLEQPVWSKKGQFLDISGNSNNTHFKCFYLPPPGPCDIMTAWSCFLKHGFFYFQKDLKNFRTKKSWCDQFVDPPLP